VKGGMPLRDMVREAVCRQILSLLHSSFSSETSAPGSPGNYLYRQGFQQVNKKAEEAASLNASILDIGSIGC